MDQRDELAFELAMAMLQASRNDCLHRLTDGEQGDDRWHAHP